MKMGNTRETNTKIKITHAFIELVTEKGLDRLAVSDIAKKASINRGTFYLHYVDKFDLLDQLEKEVLFDLQEILNRCSDDDNQNDPLEIIPYTSILEALKYVKSRFPLVNALISISGHSKFVQIFKCLISEIIEKQISRSQKLSFQMGDLPSEYAKEILLSSSMSIIFLWIKKGALETPEEIATMITKAKSISPFELLL